MKHNTKVALTVVLVILFLMTCLLAFFTIYYASWFNTYTPFTGKTLVGKFTLSEQKEDQDGKYIELEYQPIEQPSALTYLFNPQTQSFPGTIEQYKLYGDSVHIGGPIVNFYDDSLLFNFGSIYKVSTIYSRYNLDNEAEDNRKYPTSFTINGGVDPVWQSISHGENSWPYNMFVDTTIHSTPAPVSPTGGQTEKREYNLYVTKEGFVPERAN